MRIEKPRLLLVTDARFDDERIARVVECVVSVPGLAVQLRDRTARTDEQLLPLAERLRAITARHGALLVVNRRAALAQRIGADGLHAPLPELGEFRGWRSVPAHTDEDVQSARISKVDAVLVSPIFQTPGKPLARGTAAIRSARALAPELTILALGGIDVQNAAACRAAGADGVAVIRALFDTADPAHAARALAAF